MDFDTFFASSCAGMLARALVLSGSRQDAEDAVQEAYATAWSRWARVSTYDNPGAWVYKLVRQRLWKSAKRWRRLSPLSVSELSDLPATEGDPERFAEAASVLAALAELPDRQRVVLVMHCLQHMAQQEIADELGLSRGSVAASIFKARRKLEKALGMRDTDLVTLAGRESAITPAAEERDPIAIALHGVLPCLTRLQWDSHLRLRRY